MNKAMEVDDRSIYTCRGEYDPFAAGHGCSSISSGLGNVYHLLMPLNLVKTYCRIEFLFTFFYLCSSIWYLYRDGSGTRYQRT